MSNTKEIRSKIGSIENTQKITGAMEMVAASKMRKTQDAMRRSRPYAEKVLQVIEHLAKGNPEYRHTYLVPRETVKRVGYIIVSTDRSLCGGLNVNLFKLAVREMQQWQQKEVGIDLCLIGNKALAFFKRYGGNIAAHAGHLGDSPELTQLIGVVEVMLKAYEEGNIDRLYIISNQFVNTMSQKPRMQQLLPLQSGEEGASGQHWDYIYEPDAKELLELLLHRYIESQVYQAVVENIACEQAARMVAMKSASDNASHLISELKLIYNKARQAAITQELSEIIAGAAAV